MDPKKTKSGDKKKSGCKPVEEPKAVKSGGKKSKPVKK